MNLAVFPSDHSESLADGLTFAGHKVVYLQQLDAGDDLFRDSDVVVVELGDAPMRRIREAGRIKEEFGIPVFLVTAPDQLALLESGEAFTDFQVAPVEPVEFKLRINRLLTASGDDEMVVFKDLTLNTLTYQALLAGEPMDLTYVEYELLRFLVENPVRVWSREQLLSRVWGYDYFGGSRTVDVHVRRLRSKLGEERSSWISTVRSVGYRFG